MKAAVYSRYGPPDAVVQIKTVEKPIPNENELLIKVCAASVNPLDCGLLKGAGRMLTGLRKPKVGRIGVDVAGQVEAIGPKVTHFKPGDDVFGLCIGNPHASGLKVWMPHGAFAEYACVPESTSVMKPVNVTFEQAASAPVAALTALQGLRDKGQVQPGKKVLINGAAGGVGTFAVQVAKSSGAEVTGVCSTGNLDMVRSIGADYVIDYIEEDFTRRTQRYDLIFDCVGNHSLSALRGIINPNGICVMVGDYSGRGVIGLLARLVTAFVSSGFGSQKLITFLAKPIQKDLVRVRDLMEAGKVKPVIDRRYELTEVAEAMRYVEQKHARGKVVITLPNR